MFSFYSACPHLSIFIHTSAFLSSAGKFFIAYYNPSCLDNKLSQSSLNPCALSCVLRMQVSLLQFLK